MLLSYAFDAAAAIFADAAADFRLAAADFSSLSAAYAMPLFFFRRFATILLFLRAMMPMLPLPPRQIDADTFHVLRIHALLISALMRCRLFHAYFQALFSLCLSLIFLRHFLSAAAAAC